MSRHQLAVGLVWPEFAAGSTGDAHTWTALSGRSRPAKRLMCALSSVFEVTSRIFLRAIARRSRSQAVGQRPAQRPGADDHGSLPQLHHHNLLRIHAVYLSAAVGTKRRPMVTKQSTQQRPSAARTHMQRLLCTVVLRRPRAQESRVQGIVDSDQIALCMKATELLHNRQHADANSCARQRCPAHDCVPPGPCSSFAAPEPRSAEDRE